MNVKAGSSSGPVVGTWDSAASDNQLPSSTHSTAKREASRNLQSPLSDVISASITIQSAVTSFTSLNS